MSEYLVDPYKLFPVFCNVRYYEKMSQNFFFTGKTSFFFMNLSLQQPLMRYRDALIASTVIAKLHFGPLQFVP